MVCIFIKILTPMQKKCDIKVGLLHEMHLFCNTNFFDKGHQFRDNINYRNKKIQSQNRKLFFFMASNLVRKCQKIKNTPFMIYFHFDSENCIQIFIFTTLTQIFE